jgi:hypothetical protein
MSTQKQFFCWLEDTKYCLMSKVKYFLYFVPYKISCGKILISFFGKQKFILAEAFVIAALKRYV